MASEELVQGSAAWLRARNNRITGSKAAGIFGLNPFTTLKETAASVKGQSTFRGNDHCTWGRAYEKASLDLVATQCNLTVKETGLHVMKTAVARTETYGMPMGDATDNDNDVWFEQFAQFGAVAASPDGLVFDAKAPVGFQNGVLELKTPSKGLGASSFDQRKMHLYWLQVQLEMVATGRRTWTVFGVVTPLDMWVGRVPWCGGVTVSRAKFVAAGVPVEHLDEWTNAGLLDPMTQTCPGIHRLMLRIFYAFWRACQNDHEALTPREWDAWFMGGGGSKADPWHWSSMTAARRAVITVLTAVADQTKVLFHGRPKTPLVPVPRYRPRQAGFCGWPFVLAWQGVYLDTVPFNHKDCVLHRWALVSLGSQPSPSAPRPITVTSARDVLAHHRIPWPDTWIANSAENADTGQWYIDIISSDERKRDGFPKRHELDIFAVDEPHAIRYLPFPHAPKCLPTKGMYVATYRTATGSIPHQTVGAWSIQPPKAIGPPINHPLVPGVVSLQVDASHWYASVLSIAPASVSSADNDSSPRKRRRLDVRTD